jgi:hypothetical protein
VRTLARAAHRAQETGGKFLPPVLQPLENANIKARMGTTTFVAGPPGAMKTALVLYLVLRLNKPTLYFSADAEDFEIVERAAAMMSGDPISEVRTKFEDYAGWLESINNVRFVFEDSPTYDDVEMEVAAYAEVHGTFPEVIVLDNLMNVVGENENEWSSMRDTVRVIHRLTRITGAAMLVLHHMADDRTDPTTPAPRSKLQGKVGQLPKAIWSLALDGDELKIAAVKNRWGRGDASGQAYVSVFVDAERARFYNSWAEMNQGIPA